MTLFLASVALIVLIVMIGIEIAVLRARAKRKTVRVPKHARRQVLLEDRMQNALIAPRQQYGEIFSSYMIWKQGLETRMELTSTGPWRQLNEFTRSLVVRHIWRALERFSKGCVVIVDEPRQEWTAEVDRAFNDHGIDPWNRDAPAPAVAEAPLFSREPPR
jgi:hypothetical protein